MDSLHSAMNQHVKGKHLSFEERVIIQTHLKDGCSIRAIARELGCSPSTISYEVRGALFLSITASRSATRLISFLEEGWLYQLCH
ncbi:hypothetical protein IMAU60204_01940 [Lactobacillus helveticus]|nr:Transposase [Lactobacillus helveticus H9]NRO09247.1 hypothetical protein [Lactobacillus helveticus]NRO61317.1 hypothetical protein [Lactobacillus helveticus]